MVQGTLAKAILSEPDDITTMTGQKLPLKMSVDYISFSAHTDYQQTREFINILKPPHIVSNNIVLEERFTFFLIFRFWFMENKMKCKD